MPMPPPHEPITYDTFSARWPMGAEKCELIGGIVMWYGEFEEDDRLTVERAFPGRVAVLMEDGVLELHPGSQQP